MEKLKLDLTLFSNTQTTELPGLSAEMKTYYEKRLIQMAAPNLVHDQFGDKRPIPKNGGKTIEFRKYDPFKKAMTKLEEGVTPDGNRLNVSTITATVGQYGDYVEISDMLDLTAIDNNLVEATELLGDQAGLTLDTITRDVITAGTNVIYAPIVENGSETQVTARSSITSGSTLRPKEIRLAAAKLKRVNAKPFDGGYYVGIVHPDVECDLMGNPEWIDVHKYTAAVSNIFKGEIGQLAGVRFVRSSEAKIFGPKAIADDMARLTVKATISAGTSIEVNETLTEGTGISIPVYVDGEENTITAIAPASGGGSTITLMESITKEVAEGALVTGQGGGLAGNAVYATMIIGKNAYGVTEIEGGGLKHIVKQLGSAGSADPLNQRATTGWKATKTAERLIEAYMVRIEHGSAAFGDTATAN